MEKKKLELSKDGVVKIVDFFNLLGYEDFAKELLEAWNEFEKKKENVLCLYNTKNDGIDEFLAVTKNRVAEFEVALSKIKKIFSYYVSKTAVMTDNAKWRRSAV